MEDLRDLARGIYPPLLASQGLGAALRAQAAKSPVPTTVAADGVGRYPQEVEAAVYFCVLEALQNVAKYAGASHAEVRLEASGDQLLFEVADDGAGFDPEPRATARACRAWPTGWARTAAGSTSGPRPGRAHGLPGGSAPGLEAAW